jgi:hypothetical protein
MTSRVAMSREVAATTLGLPVDASPDDVRHAWRMWARISHPDVGGDPAHFARLDQARRVMMQPRPAAEGIAPAPLPRPPLSAVVHRPRALRLLAFGALAGIALAALPAMVAAPRGTIAFAVAAAPAAIAAAAWAAWATRTVATAEADNGHRMMLLSILWLPLAVAQQLTAVVAGASLLMVLPLMALPLAAAVSAVNPGAGLWRPVWDPGR